MSEVGEMQKVELPLRYGRIHLVSAGASGHKLRGENAFTASEYESHHDTAATASLLLLASLLRLLLRYVRHPRDLHWFRRLNALWLFRA